MAFAAVHFYTRPHTGRFPLKRVRRGHVEAVRDTIDSFSTAERADMLIVKMVGPAVQWAYLEQPYEVDGPTPPGDDTPSRIVVRHRRHRLKVVDLLTRVPAKVKTRIERRLTDSVTHRQHLFDIAAVDGKMQRRRRWGAAGSSRADLITQYTKLANDLDAIEATMETDIAASPPTVAATDFIDDEPLAAAVVAP